MKRWFFALIFFTTKIALSMPLPANDAFQLQATYLDTNNFSLTWQIKPGYFLYQKRLQLLSDSNLYFHLSKPILPVSSIKIDTQNNTYAIYRNQLVLILHIIGIKSGTSFINVTYQGCADDGFCYPPKTQQIKLNIDKNLALTKVTTSSSSSTKIDNLSTNTNELAPIFNHHWAIVLVTFFGLGLLLSCTPCVLPMVPVLSGIVIGHDNIATKKAFFLSLSYVLGMAVTYSIVGALIASLGNNLQIMMQKPWIIASYSLVFVILALSMFGFFELRLPMNWQTKITHLSHHQQKGHYLSAIVMGVLSTLILSPCVTAPLIAVLSYIAHDGNSIMGGLSLFFLSLGMGTPLLLIGTSAGHWLPKTGLWMETIKKFFGVLLIGVAIYLLERIMAGYLVMYCWAILLIASSIYIDVFDTKNKFKQVVGIIMLIYGLLLFIGASMGHKNLLQPLKYPIAKQLDYSTKSITSMTQLKQALAKAYTYGKPIMLDFYADWCTSCKVMEQMVIHNPAVNTILERVTVLKIDITANTNEQKELLRNYNVIAPPTFLFLNKDGIELSRSRLVGETTCENFRHHLQALPL
jgi:thiol:disulfide interchange protein DsbD